MLVIKIMNEFLHSPIWSYEDEIVSNDPKFILDDEILQVLSKQIEEMFSGYYEFDSHGQSCWFNHEKEKEDKEIMIDLISKLVARLNEINDGSYIIEDLETERLKKL